MKARPATRPQVIAAMPLDKRLLAALAAFLARNYWAIPCDGELMCDSDQFIPFLALTRPQMVKTANNISIPHPHEVAVCCGTMPVWLVRKPPGVSMWRQHCRSLVHVAALFNVPASALRRVVRTWRRLTPAAMTLKGVGG